MKQYEYRPIMADLMDQVVRGKIQPFNLYSLSYGSMTNLERTFRELGVDPNRWFDSINPQIQPGKGDPFTPISTDLERHLGYSAGYRVKHSPAVSMSREKADNNCPSPILADLQFTGWYRALDFHQNASVDTYIPFLLPYQNDSGTAKGARDLLLNLTSCLTLSPQNPILSHKTSRSSRYSHNIKTEIKPAKLLNLLKKGEEKVVHRGHAYEVHSITDLARLEWTLGSGPDLLAIAPSHIRELFNLLVGDHGFNVALDGNEIFSRDNKATFDKIREICSQAIIQDHINKLTKLINSCQAYADVFDKRYEKTEYRENGHIMNSWVLAAIAFLASQYHEQSSDGMSLSTARR